MTDYKVKVTFEDYEYKENGGTATKSDEVFIIEDAGGPEAATERVRKQSEYDIHHIRDRQYIKGTS